MGCSTYLGLGWRFQPLAPGHPTSICDIGVKLPTSIACYQGSYTGLYGKLKTFSITFFFLFPTRLKG